MVRWWTIRRCVLVAIAAVASAGLSCGGGPQADSVVGVNAVSPVASEDGAATVTASRQKGGVLVCHKGNDKQVSPGALADHMAHGDSQGSCLGPTCPCFTTQTIADFADENCSGGGNNIGGFCDVGATASYLVTTCAGTFNLATYLSSSGEIISCTGQDGVRVTGLSEAQYGACQTAMLGAPYCPTPAPGAAP